MTTEIFVIFIINQKYNSAENNNAGKTKIKLLQCITRVINIKLVTKRNNKDIHCTHPHIRPLLVTTNSQPIPLSAACLVVSSRANHKSWTPVLGAAPLCYWSVKFDQKSSVVEHLVYSGPDSVRYSTLINLSAYPVA